MNLVVDASAILAIVLNESDAAALDSKLRQADVSWISPVNWWEVRARIQSMGSDVLESEIESWMDGRGIEIAEVDAEQTRLAVEAHARFRGRPARLNLGDCFAYALAKAKDAPLLFKGNDFVATDVKRA